LAAAAEVIEVAPGVFVHQGRYELQSPENSGDMANASFVVGSEAVAVIDTSGSALMGRELRDAIRAVTRKPIRYVINTHMHPDHVFGNAAFKEDNPTFVGHYKLARALATRAESYMTANKQMLGEKAFEGSEIILPTLSLKEPTTLDLGDRTLLLEPQPTAHTDNDLIVNDAKTNTCSSATSSSRCTFRPSTAPSRDGSRCSIRSANAGLPASYRAMDRKPWSCHKRSSRSSATSPPSPPTCAG